jgi:hypothetical protein
LKRKILFICSPNLGILDNWLPVLKLLKSTGKYEIDIFFPKIETINQFNKNKLLLKISQSVFDSLVFEDFFNKYLIVKFSKKIIQKFNLNRYLHLILKILFKILKQEGFYGERYFYIINYLLIIVKKNNFKNINKNYFTNYNLICYDAIEENKNYIKVLNPILNKIKKFSMHHGSDFPSESIGNKKISINNVFFINFTKTKLENDYLNNSFIFKNKPRAFGNPKHDAHWINYIKKNKNYISGYSFKNFVLLVSRNSGSYYFPLERKVDYLKIIKKNILDKNIKIIIKLHPKENSISSKELYYEIFGKENYKKLWFFSDSHIYQLSKNCLFAITFFSGVASDLCRAGVPSIELLDLKGLEHFCSKNELFFDKNNKEPIFRIRYYGLVLGSSSEIDFTNNKNLIIQNRSKVLKKIIFNYNKFYRTNNNAIMNIKKYIEKNIE